MDIILQLLQFPENSPYYITTPSHRCKTLLQPPLIASQNSSPHDAARNTNFRISQQPDFISPFSQHRLSSQNNFHTASSLGQPANEAIRHHSVHPHLPSRVLFHPKRPAVIRRIMSAKGGWHDFCLSTAMPDSLLTLSHHF